mmetsp:Transcript_17408/g.56608  ORF Transcript_17408/g.56608 Transcript_17408/m.56608 type:complete len:209 (-) Transcript_17408:67-693(-)
MRPLSRPSRRTCGCCRSSTRRRPTRRRRSPSSSSRSRRSWAACRSWRRRCRPCSSCCTTRTSSTTRTCSSSGTRRSRKRSWAARCARRRPPSSRGSRRRTTSRRRSRTDAAAARQAAPVSRARALLVPWTCPGRVRGLARLRRPSGWPWTAGWLEAPGAAAAADAPPSLLRPARVGRCRGCPPRRRPITRFRRRSCRAYEVGVQSAEE